MLVHFRGLPAFLYEENARRLTCHYCHTIYYFSHPKIHANFQKQSIDSNEIPFRCIECAQKKLDYPFRIESPFHPNDEQKEAIITLYQQMIITPQPETLTGSFLLDGSAGTGKTSTVMSLFQYPEFNQFSIVFSAPTNKALSVMMEKFNSDEDFHEETEVDSMTTNRSFLTLFKLLNGKVSINVEGQTLFETYRKGKHEEFLHVFPYNIIVIDEISMIDRQELDFILQSLDHQSILSRQLVIFLGDRGQLPPVGEEVSHVFETSQIRHLTLYQIMRSHGQLSDLSYNVRRLIEIEKSQDTRDCDVPYLSLRSHIAPPIQYFVDRNCWLQCYVTIFRQNLEHEYSCNRNQSAPIIVCYTNAECDSLNNECRNLIFNCPTEIYVRNELLVFKSCYSVQRFKTDQSDHKIAYKVRFFTSEPVLVISSSQSEMIIPPLTLKTIFESFKNRFKLWLKHKVSSEQFEVIFSQIVTVYKKWKLVNNGDGSGDEFSSPLQSLNKLLIKINDLSRRYQIDMISLDGSGKIETSDVSPEEPI